jgi:beta-galactosidase
VGVGCYCGQKRLKRSKEGLTFRMWSIWVVTENALLSKTSRNIRAEQRAPKLFSKCAFAAAGIITLLAAFEYPARAQQSSSLNAPVKPVINDHMFAASPNARGAITFDRNGFLLHGRRTFIVSAGIEYTRVPRELWADRLLRLKRAGFNTVEIYTFWNAHEPHEGQFNFSGNYDLAAFLDLVHQMGLYAIVRVGPYYCAEWDSGGYPIWLRFKDGMTVREVNAPFEQAVDRYFGKLLPIVSARQIQHGGAVILVQLENEHPLAWGTGMPTSYFTHLLSRAKQYGLEVPIFFSGLHHASDPAGNTIPLDDASRPNPWFSTEFWSVWYDRYGPKSDDASTYERRIWKILEHGGNGYNFYMAHGGSNFDYWNNNEDAASYDYGAALGEAGDLRPLYFVDKRAAWFARSFERVLENSSDASANYAAFASESSVKVYARKGLAASLIFLDNSGSSAAVTAIHPENRSLGSPQIKLSPGEIRALVHNIQLTPGETLDWSIARVFGIATNRLSTTLVVYGTPGEAAPVLLRFKNSIRVERGGSQVLITGNTVRISPVFSNEYPSVYIIHRGSQTLRVLAVGDQLANRTWFTGEAGKQTVVIGPDYLGEMSGSGTRLRLAVEQPMTDQSNPPQAHAYGAGDGTVVLRQAGSNGSTRTHRSIMKAALSAWAEKDGTREALAGYDDSAWTKTADAVQMGFDGDVSADVWYRASVRVPHDGSYLLHLQDGGDRLQLFVDGVLRGKGPVQRNALSLQLNAGVHTLAFFVAHDGRDKLFAYIGSLFDKDPKGLVGPIYLRSGSAVDISGWRVLPATNYAPPLMPPSVDAPGWRPYSIGHDAFDHRAGYAWFQTTVQDTAPIGARRVLRFHSVDDDAMVFVNGQKLAEHKGWNKPFEVEIPPEIAIGSLREPLTLSVLVENHEEAGGIDQPVSFESFGTELLVTDWRMRGGTGDSDGQETWSALQPSASASGPRFYRSAFTLPEQAPSVHLIWRVGVPGLGHGSVWVNGHNLGRYPQKIAVDGLYIRECWLHDGSNVLMIYDEDGLAPTLVDVHVEAAASRTEHVLTERP